jgi:hypothetical protein
LLEVPSLVIDDESDQASVNTRKPTRAETKERSRINEAIVGLLALLPRGQYVGYTATPFANVFIDPADAVDLFPKDYIIPLGRPSGYMGVQDVYDFDAGESRGNEWAFVRPVTGDDTDERHLPEAIDAFVLSGALKLLRQRDGHRYSHHTMLVHRSPTTHEHEKDRALVERLFLAAGHDQASGIARLEALYLRDFLPVMQQLAPAEIPSNFTSVVPFIGGCVAKIRGNPVAIVNGEAANRDQVPNFDREDVWRILVGGTKLSRGYTVEGLTVSYYRRRAQAADTLMQMGRWFGFRQGYRDLVRLYIGRAEPLGKGQALDLYEAFRAVCLDEEKFRTDLEKYSRFRTPRLTPRQVPPLVPSHLLRPTAVNKMYNAELVTLNFGESWVERTGAPTDATAIESNLDALARLLDSDGSGLRPLELDVAGKQYRMPIWTSALTFNEGLAFLGSYRWRQAAAAAQFEPVLRFARGELGDPEIDRFLLLAPQIARGSLDPFRIDPGGYELRVVQRARVATDGSMRYGAYTEPRHRLIAEWCCGTAEGTAQNIDTEQMQRPKQAALLVYLCRDLENDKEQDKPSVGFGIYFPPNAMGQQTKFTVKDPSRKDDVVISLPDAP